MASSWSSSQSSRNKNYHWQKCDDFQIPENCVRFGEDDDGSDIFCGKAWSDGEEVPAKIIPDKRECRVRCDSGERVVPHCRKVLVCERSRDDDVCQRRRSSCHRRSRCHRRGDDCSEDEIDSSAYTKKSESSNNASRLFVKSVKSNSNSTTVSVKKYKKRGGRCHRRQDKTRQECWNEERTRMVPKVSVIPRVNYVPKITMERTVRYVPETYVTRVCAERSRCETSCCSRRCDDSSSCDSWDSCDDECVVPNERCKEVLVCKRPSRRCEVNRGRCC